MEFNDVIGLDVSKETIDAVSYHTNAHLKFKNNKTGFRKFKSWVVKELNLNLEQTLTCLEHTGLYSYRLVKFLEENQAYFVVASGLEIKKSMGLQRGKDDKIDARSIAIFAYRRREELKRSKAPEEDLVVLKGFYAMRKKLVKNKGGLTNSLTEIKATMDKAEAHSLVKHYEKLIKAINKSIKEVEAQILAIIKANKSYYQNYKLAITVPGIGPVMAVETIITTENFTRFQNWRQYACYIGIAPFPKQSGTSVRGKNKVSKIGHRGLKIGLLMSANAAVKHDPELKKYYNERLEKGKNKMSTLNIIKNKIISRLFAVIDRGEPYVNTYRYAAA